MNRRNFFSRLFGGAAAAVVPVVPVVPVAVPDPKPKKETFTLETIEMKVEVIKCYTKTMDGGWIMSCGTPNLPDGIIPPLPGQCPHGAT